MFIHLNGENYKKAIADTAQGVLICSKNLCPHCKNMEKVLEKFSAQRDGVVFFKLDTEDETVACADLGAERAPTLFVIKQGAIRAMKAGLMNPKEMAIFYDNAK